MTEREPCDRRLIPCTDMSRSSTRCAHSCRRYPCGSRWVRIHQRGDKINCWQTVRSNEQMMQSMKGATSKACSVCVFRSSCLTPCRNTGYHEQADESPSLATDRHGVREGERHDGSATGNDGRCCRRGHGGRGRRRERRSSQPSHGRVRHRSRCSCESRHDTIRRHADNLAAR